MNNTMIIKVNSCKKYSLGELGICDASIEVLPELLELNSCMSYYNLLELFI